MRNINNDTGGILQILSAKSQTSMLEVVLWNHPLKGNPSFRRMSYKTTLHKWNHPIGMASQSHILKGNY